MRDGQVIEFLERIADGYRHYPVAHAHARRAIACVRGAASPPPGAVMVPCDTEMLSRGEWTKEPLHVLLEGDEASGYRLTFCAVSTPAPADEADEAGPWLTRAADRMAHEVVRLTDSGTLGTRTPLTDALLDYATTRHGQTDPIGQVRATGGPRG